MIDPSSLVASALTTPRLSDPHQPHYTLVEPASIRRSMHRPDGGDELPTACKQAISSPRAISSTAPQPRKICQRARQPVDLVDDDDVDPGLSCIADDAQG